MYPDLAGVAALITALGTLVLVLVNHQKGGKDAAASMTTASAHSLEASVKRIDQLTQRVEELEKRLEESNQHSNKLEKRLAIVEAENTQFRHGIGLLIEQICSLKHTPVWQPDWDKS